MLTFSAAATPMKRCEHTRVRRARQRGAQRRRDGSRLLARSLTGLGTGRLARRTCLDEKLTIDAVSRFDSLFSTTSMPCARDTRQTLSRRRRGRSAPQGAHVAARERHHRRRIAHVDAKHAHDGQMLEEGRASDVSK
jgi:hypothetical protein